VTTKKARWPYVVCLALAGFLVGVSVGYVASAVMSLAGLVETKEVCK
jgi:hypothetical protein